MSPSGARLEELWAEAAAEPAVSLFRTAPCGTDTSQGPVLVAVHKDGSRNLLIPIDAKHTLREDVDGNAVTLRRRVLEDATSRRTYAVLALVDGRLADLFTALCVEVVTRIAAKPDRAVTALRQTLADWRSLLSGSRRTLGPSELAGLFGELELLRTMVALDNGAVSFWTGPSGTAQDFHRGKLSLEAKATVSPESRTIRVHGAGQLAVAESGRLLLVWFRLGAGGGRSVPDLIDEIMAATDDEASFLAALREAGYLPTDRELYSRRLFEVDERRVFEIGPGFPRVTAAGLIGDATLAGVDRIHYDVDLDSAPAAATRVDLDPARAFLELS
ncbi:PD-(D/E)XK motif protein [Pseudonocardia humida]|uniref:PD-(D/E)XK motif protein n=1 Tax=Pseudonocardia humida TaxID=2800819 RepID=A0ABT0ZX41_9PSEU|nr:PD-(D/E)XK motif protein [Pseudonocardia humida]MCO1655303.1 PD-(D/E)XK motif protein [Pseudonocardia humida]